MRHEMADRFYCAGSGTITVPPEKPADFDSYQTHQSDLYQSTYNRIIQANEAAEDIAGIISDKQHAAYFRGQLETENINKVGIIALWRLAKVVKKESARIMKALADKSSSTKLIMFKLI